MLQIGTVLGAAQIALAATCGYDSIEVFTRPPVAILTTGDETPFQSTSSRAQARFATRML